MASIIRDGNRIELTPEEIQTIRQHEHEQDIRYDVEESLRVFEEDGQISFDSWQNCPCGSYGSEDDARADFVEYVVMRILEHEDNFEEHAPLGYRYTPDYDGEVYDTAVLFEYMTEE